MRSKGFGGMIPQQLGNVSNLHSLDLESSYHSNLRSDSPRWVTVSYWGLGDASTDGAGRRMVVLGDGMALGVPRATGSMSGV